MSRNQISTRQKASDPSSRSPDLISSPKGGSLAEHNVNSRYFLASKKMFRYSCSFGVREDLLYRTLSLASGFRLITFFVFVHSSHCDDIDYTGKIAPKSRASGLCGSLVGLSKVLPPPVPIWFLVASSDYRKLVDHPSAGSCDMISSASQDVGKIIGAINEFEGGHSGQWYCDGYEHPVHGRSKPAKARKLVHVLKERKSWSYSSTFIYLAFHRSDARDGFLTQDCTEATASKHTIHDSEIRNTILASLGPDSKPLLLFTEACNTDNVIELPYYIEMVDDEIRRKEVAEHKKHDWDGKPIVVHISATIPDHKAACFKVGAVATQAFNNLFKAPIKLAELLGAMQNEVNRQLRESGAKDNSGNPLSQRLRIYYSKPEVLEASTLWESMGFRLKPDRQGAVLSN